VGLDAPAFTRASLLTATLKGRRSGRCVVIDSTLQAWPPSCLVSWYENQASHEDVEVALLQA